MRAMSSAKSYWLEEGNYGYLFEPEYTEEEI